MDHARGVVLPATPSGEALQSKSPAKHAAPKHARQQQADAGPRGPRWSWPSALAPFGLYAVLTAQAILSLRLMWSNTAFLDEATYLYVGHVEIAHWLTGSSVPAYPTYLSGAPVIYPPLAAIANDIGGLAAARILSLCFMLGATCTLWGMTRRLADRRAAFFAAAIFVALGPTQYLGAFATYDAMALFLMTAAAWCVVAARDHTDSTMWVLAGAAFMALANATKYATGLFDPVVVGLAALSVATKRGRKEGMGRAGYLAVIAIGTLAALIALGGPFYVTGVLSTTLARASGGSSPVLVLADAAKWIGAVCILAVVAVLVAALAREGRYQVAILALLTVAGLLAPFNQARIHTTTSLSKHVDFGAWFAAAAAGYALARISKITRFKTVHAATAMLATAAAVIPIGFIGRQQAGDFFQAWPDSARVTAILRSVTAENPGHYLAEDYDVAAYYLENSIPWNRWSDTWYFRYTQPPMSKPLVGPVAYRKAIADGYFKLVVLDFGDTAAMDKIIAQAMHASGNYHVIAEAPYWDKFGVGRFTIWAYSAPHRQHAAPPSIPISDKHP